MSDARNICIAPAISWIAWSAASASLERGADLSAIDCRPSRRISIAIRNDRWAAVMSSGVAIRFACWYCCSAWPRKPLISATVVALRRIAEQVEERLADLLVGGAHERADVAVVVLQRVLLGRVAAAADDEDEQDEDEDAAAEHTHGESARSGGPGGAAAAAARPARAGPVCGARRPRRRRTRKVSPGAARSSRGQVTWSRI